MTRIALPSPGILPSHHTTTSTLTPPTLPLNSPLTHIPFPLYTPTSHSTGQAGTPPAKEATHSPDATTTTLLSHDHTSSPLVLEALLKQQMQLPPRPTVRITGRIQNGIVLFDLSLDLLRQISPDKERCGQWAYTKVTGMAEAGGEPLRIEEKEALMGEAGGGGGGARDVTGARFWIRRFCGDGAEVKRFILRREVINWDTQFLATKVRELVVKEAGFRGIVDIQFPIQRSNLTIQTPPKTHALLTSLRTLFVAPKTYNVLAVIWPYATLPRGVGGGGGGGGGSTSSSGVGIQAEGESEEVKEKEDQSRQCIQSEEEWFDEWKGAIRIGVCGARRGWLGEGDKIDALMAGF